MLATTLQGRVVRAASLWVCLDFVPPIEGSNIMRFVRLPKSQPLCRSLKVVTALTAALMPSLADAAPWALDPQVQLPDSGLVTQKLELVERSTTTASSTSRSPTARAPSIGNDQNAQLNQLLISDGGAGFTEQGGVFEDPDNAYGSRPATSTTTATPTWWSASTTRASASYLLNEGTGESPPPGHLLAERQQEHRRPELGDVDGDGYLVIRRHRLG